MPASPTAESPPASPLGGLGRATGSLRPDSFLFRYRSARLERAFVEDFAPGRAMAVAFPLASFGFFCREFLLEGAWVSLAALGLLAAVCLVVNNAGRCQAAPTAEHRESEPRRVGPSAVVAEVSRALVAFFTALLLWIDITPDTICVKSDAETHCLTRITVRWPVCALALFVAARVRFVAVAPLFVVLLLLGLAVLAGDASDRTRSGRTDGQPHVVTAAEWSRFGGSAATYAAFLVLTAFVIAMREWLQRLAFERRVRAALLERRVAAADDLLPALQRIMAPPVLVAVGPGADGTARFDSGVRRLGVLHVVFPQLLEAVDSREPGKIRAVAAYQREMYRMLAAASSEHGLLLVQGCGDVAVLMHQASARLPHQAARSLGAGDIAGALCGAATAVFEKWRATVTSAATLHRIERHHTGGGAMAFKARLRLGAAVGDGRGCVSMSPHRTAGPVGALYGPVFDAARAAAAIAVGGTCVVDASVYHAASHLFFFDEACTVPATSSHFFALGRRRTTPLPGATLASTRQSVVGSAPHTPTLHSCLSDADETDAADDVSADATAASRRSSRAFERRALVAQWSEPGGAGAPPEAPGGASPKKVCWSRFAPAERPSAFMRSDEGERVNGSELTTLGLPSRPVAVAFEGKQALVAVADEWNRLVRSRADPFDCAAESRNPESDALVEAEGIPRRPTRYKLPDAMQLTCHVWHGARFRSDATEQRCCAFVLRMRGRLCAALPAILAAAVALGLMVSTAVDGSEGSAVLAALLSVAAASFVVCFGLAFSELTRRKFVAAAAGVSLVGLPAMLAAVAFANDATSWSRTQGDITIVLLLVGFMSTVSICRGRAPLVFVAAAVAATVSAQFLLSFQVDPRTVFTVLIGACVVMPGLWYTLVEADNGAFIAAAWIKHVYDNALDVRKAAVAALVASVPEMFTTTVSDAFAGESAGGGPAIAVGSPRSRTPLTTPLDDLDLPATDAMCLVITGGSWDTFHGDEAIAHVAEAFFSELPAELASQAVRQQRGRCFIFVVNVAPHLKAEGATPQAWRDLLVQLAHRANAAAQRAGAHHGVRACMARGPAVVSLQPFDEWRWYVGAVGLPLLTALRGLGSAMPGSLRIITGGIDHLGKPKAPETVALRA